MASARTNDYQIALVAALKPANFMSFAFLFKNIVVSPS